MSDSRTVAQLEAERFFWIGTRCCKGIVMIPFKMLRPRIPDLDAWTLDQVGSKLRCDRCGQRPQRYEAVRQEDAHGYARSF